LFVVLSLDSCKKEEEFQDVIDYAHESSLVINSLSGLLETAFDVMSYNTEVSNINNTLINDDGYVFFTDKYFFDNNGVACRVYFGDKVLGTKGYDYRYKSGKMDVKMSSYYGDPNNRITITINTPDKLRVHDEYEYDKFESYDVIGVIEIHRIGGQKWFYETKNYSMESSKKKLDIELAGYLNISDGRIEGFIDNFYTATYSGNINQEYTISTSEDKALTKDLGKDCTGNYQQGTYYISTNSGVTASMDFDPYNDEACDPYAKLTWDTKEELIVLP
jgi:hypothetical protein